MGIVKVLLSHYYHHHFYTKGGWYADHYRHIFSLPRFTLFAYTKSGLPLLIAVHHHLVTCYLDALTGKWRCILVCNNEDDDFHT